LAIWTTKATGTVIAIVAFSSLPPLKYAKRRAAPSIAAAPGSLTSSNSAIAQVADSRTRVS
jgi:hypothetical protein